MLNAITRSDPWCTNTGGSKCLGLRFDTPGHMVKHFSLQLVSLVPRDSLLNKLLLYKSQHFSVRGCMTGLYVEYRESIITDGVVSSIYPIF